MHPKSAYHERTYGYGKLSTPPQSCDLDRERTLRHRVGRSARTVAREDGELQIARTCPQRAVLSQVIDCHRREIEIHRLRTVGTATRQRLRRGTSDDRPIPINAVDPISERATGQSRAPIRHRPLD